MRRKKKVEENSSTVVHFEIKYIKKTKIFIHASMTSIVKTAQNLIEAKKAERNGSVEILYSQSKKE